MRLQSQVVLAKCILAFIITIESWGRIDFIRKDASENL